MVDLASRKRGSWRSRAAIIDAMEKGKCCTPLCPGIVLAFVPNMSIKLLLYCRPEWYVKWYPQCCICWSPSSVLRATYLRAGWTAHATALDKKSETEKKWLKIINSQEAIGNEEKVATKMHETKENEAFFVRKLLWCRTHPAWYTGKHDPGRKWGFLTWCLAL